MKYQQESVSTFKQRDKMCREVVSHLCRFGYNRTEEHSIRNALIPFTVKTLFRKQEVKDITDDIIWLII